MAYRLELDPNKTQGVLFAKHAGAKRFVWNMALRERIDLYEKNKDSKDPKAKRTNAIEQHKALNARKAGEFPWMYEVSKCAPQEALRDLDQAYSNFYRRLREGDPKPGFPKFKKKFVHDSFRLTGAIKVADRSVTLPRIGKVRTKEGTEKFKGRILSATVSREADRWYAALQVEVNRPDPAPVQGGAVGVDLNFKEIVVATADGAVVERFMTPRPLEWSLKALARRQRRHDRKQKGSNNRRRSSRALSRLHRRIKYRRLDFLHKLTTKLTKTKSVIVVEDLAVRNMIKNPRLARGVGDGGWGEFRRQIEYKTVWYGSRLVVADRFYPSSKTCSSCGWVKDDLGSKREFVCQRCGLVMDRDENAGINLARLAAGATGSSPGSHACRGTTAGLASKTAERRTDGRRPRRSRNVQVSVPS